MRFSVCIPNYNYGRYLGQTIKSVLDQEGADVEVVVSDNASTDDSVAVVNSFGDPRIRLSVNRRNLGFAANLDCAGSMASGDFMIMLSSDDLMQPYTLKRYETLFRCLGADAQSTVVTSTWDIIDPRGEKTGSQGPDKALWTERDRDKELEAAASLPLYSVPATELLKRCLERLRNPFNFAATCYPRKLYEQVVGYGAGRLINPDKWFHWKLLTVAKKAYFVDAPLFSYRWHPSNQTALEQNSGSLKFLVDEYNSTLELDDALLKTLGLSRQDVILNFLENDILHHGLATLARGSRLRAKRILRFGEAVYPEQLRALKKRWLFKGLLGMGPLGGWIARRAYARYRQEINHDRPDRS
jgi:glycosyltransferase involved in cell wall biosynthesis